MKQIAALTLALSVLLLTTGCASSLQAKKMPGTDLSKLKTFYV